MPNHTETLLRCLSLIGCLLISACASSQDGDTAIRTAKPGVKVRTTIQNSWNEGAKAVVNKVYNGAWEFHELESGESVVVRVYRSDFLTGTFDRASHYEIAFQIPSDTQPGQEISLRPVPSGRSAKQEGEYKRLASMKEGEITAFRYGNPLMGWMKQCKIAKVKIVSIGDTEVVIHLRLKADLEESWDFDMDEQFTLKVTSPTQRENKRLESNG